MIANIGSRSFLISFAGRHFRVKRAVVALGLVQIRLDIDFDGRVVKRVNVPPFLLHKSTELVIRETLILVLIEIVKDSINISSWQLYTQTLYPLLEFCSIYLFVPILVEV
jgi:hypothetical protein